MINTKGFLPQILASTPILMFVLLGVSLPFVNFQANESNINGDNTIEVEPINICKGQPRFYLTYPYTYQKALANLRAAGGKEDDIVLIDSLAAILDQFVPFDFPVDFAYGGKSRNAMAYKFGLSSQCQLHVSRFLYQDRGNPAKNIHHHLVAKGEIVYAAGAIFFFHDGLAITKIVISNRSGRFCPSFQSLDVVKALLINFGIAAERIVTVQNDRCDL